MASGMKKMVINTQERAISPDINRLQDFKAADSAEFARYLMDVSENFDLAPGVVTEYSSVSAPLRAEVVNGIMVTPQIGSLDLLVTPGLLYALAPDGGAEDSNYKFVRSLGITVLGTLSMTANASGFLRIDVIECSVTDTIVETDNRDIFNPTTGLFTAAAVTKAREGRLTFRVRAGVPGSGYPAAVSGWLPLAVASVPTGTTSNDTVTFWDVRPLVSDRVRGLSAGEEEMPTWGEMNFRVQNNGGVTASDLTGIARVAYRGRWLGGALRRGTPGATDTYVTNLRDADVKHGGGFAYTTGALYTVWLMTPFGLPRWSRYTDFGAGFRRPRSPNGILMVSNIPSDARSRPASPIPLPDCLGGIAAGSTSEGVCISTGIMFATGLGGFVTSDRRTIMTNAAVTLANTITPGASSVWRSYVLPGVSAAGNATRALFKLRVYLQSPNAPTAYNNFDGVNPAFTIREEPVANPGTGFTYVDTSPSAGFTVRVANDNVYYIPTVYGTDIWVPFAGAVWPRSNAHAAPGYDVGVYGWALQEDFPANPILVSAALYVQGWEF